MKVLNLIPPGEATGWGICGRYIAKHLPDYCEIASSYNECDAILCPVDNNNWGYGVPLPSGYESRRVPVIGYGFNEFQRLGEKQIAELPKNYTALACGSTWMKDWVQLALHEIAPGFPLAVVLQGVDDEIFHFREQEKPDFMKDRWVIGSAGKFEYRKGQDVVIEAFRRFKKSVPEAMLLLNWTNMWTETMMSMTASPYKHEVELVNTRGIPEITGVHRDLIAPTNQVSWMLGSHTQMGAFYQNMDCFIGPSRVEAAQGNCYVEACASGIPSILVDDHGCRDLVDYVDDTCCIPLTEGKRVLFPPKNPIAIMTEPCIDELVSDMHRMHRQQISNAEKMHLSNIMGQWSWKQTAKGIADLCRKVV